MNCCDAFLTCNEGRNCPVRASRLNTTDGGEQVSGSIAMKLHRQVLPPEPEDSDGAYWWMFGIAAVAVICAVLAVIHFAKYQF